MQTEHQHHHYNYHHQEEEPSEEQHHNMNRFVCRSSMTLSTAYKTAPTSRAKTTAGVKMKSHCKQYQPENVDSINRRLDQTLSGMRRVNHDVGYNMFDNMGWREWGVSCLLRQHGYDTFQLLQSRVGRDAECPGHGLHNIEIKTSTIKTKRLRASNGVAEFCRQNTEHGLKTASNGYDGIVFGLFKRLVRTPVLAVFIRQPTALVKFRALVEQHQDEFARLAREQGSTMVNGRDSIRVPLSDVYDALETHEYEMFYHGERVENAGFFVTQLRGRRGVSVESPSEASGT